MFNLVLPCCHFETRSVADLLTWPQRLAGKDIDNWEQKRVKRLPGETDGIL